MPALNFPYHKTRIAPTPSGFLHLGNLLSFLITAFIAERENAAIVLRIDDLDRNRVRDIYIQDIFETLKFFNIPWNEGPRNPIDFQKWYSQTKRINLYNDALNMLREKNLVYACTCSRTMLGNSPGIDHHICKCAQQKIPLDKANAAWRLKTGTNPEIEFIDYSSGKKKEILATEMSDFVVKKKDGNASYQLTSIIDDIYLGIDLIIRGNDLYPSTIAQNILAAVLEKEEFKQITFLHHPLILGDSGEKLSKSAGATSLHYLRKAGFTAIDIYNQLAFLLGFTKKVNSGAMLAEMVLNNAENL